MFYYTINGCNSINGVIAVGGVTGSVGYKVHFLLSPLSILLYIYYLCGIVCTFNLFKYDLQRNDG